jgi:hypothetical protein
VLYLVLQVYGLSLTRLELLISLLQLSLDVVDVALGDSQLILCVLQLGVGVVVEVSLDVTTVISHHQLIIQFLDARLKAGGLLEKFLVALLTARFLTFTWPAYSSRWKRR